MKYFITGGCGFLGSNLAKRAIEQGHEVVVFDNLSRLGADTNLQWLKTVGHFTFVHGDIRNASDVFRAINRHHPDAIFHLAGQVAMTTSIDEPRRDFEVNALGSFNVLEGVRMHAPDAVVVYSSTNKVYGDLEWATTHEMSTRYQCPDYPMGFDEKAPLDFHSPYGCSKGAADQYMLDYARIFGLKTVVFRHSSIYGDRQFSTIDQGWIGWFCQKAVEQAAGHTAPFTIAGNGKQVRDVLHADDAVAIYFAAIDQIDAAQGQAFNIGGGMNNSLSLLELFDLLREYTHAPMCYTETPWRLSDQRIFVADITKANQVFGWSPTVSSKEGVERMIAWISQGRRELLIAK